MPDGEFPVWVRAGLPCPTIVAINPKNGHAHLFYELNEPVSVTERALLAPQRWLAAIENAYHNRLTRFGCDLAFTGTRVKNPLHARWRVVTRDVSYSLAQLGEWLDPPDLGSEVRISVTTKKPELDESHRKQSLFDVVRFWAYRAIQQATDARSWHAQVLAEVRAQNACFSAPLGISHERSIAKSISGWTWHRRDALGLRPNEGVMAEQLGPAARRNGPACDPIEIRRREQAGAEYSAKVKREATERKVRAAIKAVKADGRRPRATVIAAMTGLSRQTVAQYLRALEET